MVDQSRKEGMGETVFRRIRKTSSNGKRLLLLLSSQIITYLLA